MCGNGISTPSLSKRFFIDSNKSHFILKAVGKSLAHTQARKVTQESSKAITLVQVSASI